METYPNLNTSPSAATASGDAKACANCHTTKTSLWRGGPEGPKSLCNACGIRYRKRRQAIGLDAAAAAAAANSQQDLQQPKKKAAVDPQQQDQHQLRKKTTAVANPQQDRHQPRKRAAAAAAATDPQHTSITKKDTDKKDQQVTVDLHVVGFGKEATFKQRRRMRHNKCMSEEERAAVLLMALSSGVIYAS